MSKDIKNAEVESMGAALAKLNTLPTIWESYVEHSKDNIVIDDCVLDHWKKYFYIKIPQEDVTPGEAKKIAARCGNLMQEVGTKIRNMKIMLKSFQGAYNLKVLEQIEKNKKILKDKDPNIKKYPARADMEAWAQRDLKDLTENLIKVQGVLEFYEGIQKDLAFVLSVVTQINTANAHEIKADGFIPRVP